MMFGSEELKNAVHKERDRLGIRGDERLEGYWLAMFSYLLGSLEGKRILDIGCGGDYKIERHSEMLWHPLFPRLVKRYGVDAVGLDPTVNTEQEDFTAIRGYAEELPKLFPNESFDGVLVSNFWNQPHLTYRHEIQRTRVLQSKTYREIFRILRLGGVSINFSNQDPNSYVQIFPPSQQELIEIGFRTVYYFSGDGYGDDLIVLRKSI